MDDVLLITIDSLRADHVGYHGYHRDTTPIIDGWAADSCRFMNTFAHAGGTKYAFPSILTGVTPLMYGGHDMVSNEQTIVSEVFQEAGYRTGGIHSNLYLSRDYGYDRGFDYFFDSKTQSSLTSRARQYVKNHLSESFIYPFLQEIYDGIESTGGVNIGSYHVPGDEITDKAIQFLRKDDSDKPTFLWVHYMDVHHPFLPPEEYQTLFMDEPVTDREAIQLRQKFANRPGEVTDDELETFIALYDAEIRFNDDEIGRLLSVAREELTTPTIALTADHGEHFLERGYFSGAQFYDVKLHVPLVIEGLGDPETYDELVALTDIPTTLVDHAGLSVPDNFQGHSLVDLVAAGEWPRTTIVGGLGTDNPEYMLRTSDWKYIERGTDLELYDLNEDQAEQHNVAADHPDLIEQFSGELDQHRQRIADTDTDLDAVEVDEQVKARLRRLGYDE